MNLLVAAGSRRGSWSLARKARAGHVKSATHSHIDTRNDDRPGSFEEPKPCILTASCVAYRLACEMDDPTPPVP